METVIDNGAKKLPFSEWKSKMQAEGKWLSLDDYKAKKAQAYASKPYGTQPIKPFSR